MSDELSAVREEIARLRQDLDRMGKFLDGIASAGEARTELRTLKCETIQIRTEPESKSIEVCAREDRAGIYFYDGSGNCRALLEVTEKGARFEIVNEDQQTVVSSKAVDGHGQVCVGAPDGTARAAIRSTKLGGLVKVVNQRGRPLGFLLGTEKGGVLELNNPGHRTGISMYAEGDGGMLRIHQGGGEVMASMSAHDDSGLLTVFGTLGEQAVTLCASDEGGHVLICDTEGNVRTNLV